MQYLEVILVVGSFTSQIDALSRKWSQQPFLMFMFWPQKIVKGKKTFGIIMSHCLKNKRKQNFDHVRAADAISESKSCHEDPESHLQSFTTA